jgi:hypothetical protein
MESMQSMVKIAVDWAGGREGLTMDFMDDMDFWIQGERSVFTAGTQAFIC